MKSLIKLLITLMLLCVSVPLNGALLLDHGCNYSSTSVSVISGRYTGFQPFTVIDTEWQIESIGVYGYRWSGTGTTMRAKIRPDLNNRPNESTSRGEFFYSLPDFQNRGWVDAQIDIILPKGKYWIEFRPFNTIVNDLYPGLRGEDHFARNNADGREFINDAYALRIYGSVIPEPATLSLLALGGILIRKRK